MNIKMLKQLARDALASRWSQVVIIAGIWIVLSWVGDHLTKLEVILTIFVIHPILTGIKWYFLDLYDEKKLKVTSIFNVFNYYFKVIITSLLINLFTFLWGLLFIIPGIIKACAYSQSLYVLRDNPELGALEAIKKSEEIMVGKKSDYVATIFSFAGWLVVPLICWLIALSLQNPDSLHNRNQGAPLIPIQASMTDNEIIFKMGEEEKRIQLAEDELMSHFYLDEKKVFLSRNGENYIFIFEDQEYILGQVPDDGGFMAGIWSTYDEFEVSIALEEEVFILVWNDEEYYIEEGYETLFQLDDLEVIVLLEEDTISVTTEGETSEFPLNKDTITMMMENNIEFKIRHRPLQTRIVVNQIEAVYHLSDEVLNVEVNGIEMTITPNTERVVVTIDGDTEFSIANDEIVESFYADYSNFHEFTSSFDEVNVELNLSSSRFPVVFTTTGVNKGPEILSNLYIWGVSCYLIPFYLTTMAAFYRNLNKKDELI